MTRPDRSAGARRPDRSVVLEENFERLIGSGTMEHKIESVMTAEVVTARPASSFRELVDLLVKEGYPHGGDDAGMVDALRHRRRLGKAAGACAADVMTRRVVTVPLGTDVAVAARLMVRLGVKRLPVVDEEDRVVGIVTRGDLLRMFLRPEPAISWDVRHDVLRDRMGVPDGEVSVEVRHGLVTLTGQVERRSQIPALVRHVQAVDGVVTVDARLAWRLDDVTPMAAWPIA